MDLAIQLGSYLLWFPLEILTLSAILRVGVRRYPLIFAYTAVTFLIAVAELPLAFAYFRSDRTLQSNWYQLLRSYGDGVTYLLILAVVFSLIHRASARMGARRVIRVALVAGGFVFAGISFLIHYDSNVAIGIWMTPWTRDLNFGAAVLDMALWLLLISSREKDQRLLLLTGGMGIMFAGEAVGQAVRSLAIRTRSHNTIMAGHVLMLVADLVFLYIWWQTFRKEAANRADEGSPAPRADFIVR